MAAYAFKRRVLKQLAIPFQQVNLVYISAALLTIIVLQTIFMTKTWTYPVQKISVAKPETACSSVSYFPSTSQSVESTSRPNLVSPRPDVCNACFVHNYSYIIDNEDICSTKGNRRKVRTLVVITTLHTNIHRREALRATWLSLTRNNTADIRYAFLLGLSPNDTIQIALERENILFHDLIQEDFIDSYYNLTLKTIMGFKWASTKCKGARFFMKTDDDMFVNLVALKNIIRKKKRTLQKSIIGFCKLVRIPIRTNSSKWYMSHENYPRKKYPVYCSGTGYVTSMNVVHKVYHVSKNVPFVFLEDVYISLCMENLGFNMTHMDGFNPSLVTPGCFYKTNEMVTSHRLSPELLREIWRNCSAL